MSAGKRLRIAPGVVQNFMPYRFHAEIEAGLALVGFVFYAGLVRIDEIIFSEFVWCEVRHDNISANHNGFLATERVDSLVGSGCHHVDFRHHQAQNGNHFQSEIHAVFCRWNLVFILIKRCIRMRDEWTHSDHCDIFTLEKHQIIGQIVQSLERKAHHYSCSCLIA